MYSRCMYKPNIPQDCEEFFMPPDLPPEQKSLLPVCHGRMSFRALIHHLKCSKAPERAEMNIWEFDQNGDMTEFGWKGRRMIRDIADYLRTLHLSSKFCGNLLDFIFVHPPYMTVTFPETPREMLHDGNISGAIREDTLQFRHLIAYLIKCTPEMYVNNRLRSLPTNFRFFFSKVFIVGLNANDASTVREHSFYQLYHDATFDSLDRIRFIRLITAYRLVDTDLFEKSQLLSHPQYELQDWRDNFPKGHFLHSTMVKATDIKVPAGRPFADRCACIPRFIRNVHHHFSEKKPDGPKSTHEEIDTTLNAIFPAICSKILDSILRTFNEDLNNFHNRLATRLECKPFGFGPRKVTETDLEFEE